MRDLITIIDQHFINLHRSSVELLRTVNDKDLFARIEGFESVNAALTCGEQIVRSAAVVEQAFGGISSRLWDDPFEWTLPEELSTVQKVEEYLNEVELFRTKCMPALGDDGELSRTIPAPEDLKSILEILLEAISRSADHLGKAKLLIQIRHTDKSAVREP